MFYIMRDKGYIGITSITIIDNVQPVQLRTEKEGKPKNR